MEKTRLKMNRIGLCLILISIALTSCQKDEEVFADLRETEAYQLVDVMIVNSSSGLPRKPENLSLLGQELHLDKNGTFTFSPDSYMKKGKWIKENNKLVLYSLHADDTPVTVEKDDEQNLELFQEYKAEKGYAGGVVYYSFTKNE